MKDRDLVSYFYTWLSSFPCTICSKGCCFSNMFFWHLCQASDLRGFVSVSLIHFYLMFMNGLRYMSSFIAFACKLNIFPSTIHGWECPFPIVSSWCLFSNWHCMHGYVFEFSPVFYIHMIFSFLCASFHVCIWLFWFLESYNILEIRYCNVCWFSFFLRRWLFMIFCGPIWIKGFSFYIK